MTDWQAIVERLKSAVETNLPDPYESAMTTKHQANKAKRLYWHILALAEAEKMAERGKLVSPTIFSTMICEACQQSLEDCGCPEPTFTSTCSCGRTKAWVSDLSDGTEKSGHYACEVCDPITVRGEASDLPSFEDVRGILKPDEPCEHNHVCPRCKSDEARHTPGMHVPNQWWCPMCQKWFVPECGTRKDGE